MPNTSELYAVMEAVQTRIRALITAGTISGVASASVRVRKVPSSRGFGRDQTYTYPGILIVPGVAETIPDGTNERDDIGLPVLIVISVADQQDVEANQDTYLDWRSILLREFRHKYLTVATPATTFHDCIVEPGPIVDWNTFMENGVFVSVIGLRFFHRESRVNA